MKCVVLNCKSKNYGKGYDDCSFFRFPSDAAIHKRWVDFCGIEKKFITKSPYICMHHFKTEDFENNFEFKMGFCKKRLLKRGAVPSIDMASIGNVELYKQRAARIEKRERKKLVASLLETYYPTVKPTEVEIPKPEDKPALDDELQTPNDQHENILKQRLNLERERLDFQKSIAERFLTALPAFFTSQQQQQPQQLPILQKPFSAGTQLRFIPSKFILKTATIPATNLASNAFTAADIANNSKYNNDTAVLSTTLLSKGTTSVSAKAVETRTHIDDMQFLTPKVESED